MLNICSKCKKDCGMEEQPALYVFNGEDYCTECMKETAPYYKSDVDRACAEGKEFLKVYNAGKYMKSREDILGYGKKKKK